MAVEDQCWSSPPGPPWRHSRRLVPDGTCARTLQRRCSGVRTRFRQGRRTSRRASKAAVGQSIAGAALTGSVHSWNWTAWSGRAAAMTLRGDGSGIAKPAVARGNNGDNLRSQATAPANRRVVPAVEHWRRKSLNKVEEAHRPAVRQRKQQVKRFQSAGQVQCFFSAHEGSRQLFPIPPQLPFS